MVHKRLTQLPPSKLTKVNSQTEAMVAKPAGIGLFSTGKNTER
ncbi:Uncharacterised protein [Vibrio cholerae]|nr:Uncharacterised protein [Vibrio cholerae]